MKNFRCTIAYCGTPYFGFKSTKMGPNIEDTLQTCLHKILQHPVVIQGASLTDRGVHADGQIINFLTDQSLDIGKTLCSMRSLLPKTIAPLELIQTSDDFHPSLDARFKEYHYQICNLPTQLPSNREFSWHCPLPLDLISMEEATHFLMGKHDFSAFSNKRYEDPTRTLTRISIVESEQYRLRIEIDGDRFLYKMVRNLVGTLVAIGRGKIKAKEIPHILKSQDRRQAGITAPAHGLTLKRVYY